MRSLHNRSVADVANNRRLQRRSGATAVEFKYLERSRAFFLHIPMIIYIIKARTQAYYRSNVR